MLLSSVFGIFCVSASVGCLRDYAAHHNYATSIPVALGQLMASSLPLIGLFDNKEHNYSHCFFAAVFFVSAVIFSVWTAVVLLESVSEPRIYPRVVVMCGLSALMCILILAFGVLTLTGVGPAHVEWLLAIVGVGYFGVGSSMN